MPKLTLRTISYKDLKEYKYKLYDDPYGITAFMTDHLRETLLACPNNDDDSKTAMYLMLDDNIAVARELQFCTKIQIDKDFIVRKFMEFYSNLYNNTTTLSPTT